MYADSENYLYMCGIVLSHCDNYVIFGFPSHIRNNASFYRFPVHGERLYTLLNVVGIQYFDVVGAFPELTG